MDPSTTAIVAIEYQNEFTSEGGKLYPAVKGVMEATNMLEKSVAVVEKARSAGVKIYHVPISFRKDFSDVPNKGQGILAGIYADKLFEENTWNSEICTPMAPKDGDVVVTGKKGLDAFPGTNLEEMLVKDGIRTVVLLGFLTNCCVESTMRTAYEKGWNVLTLTDCCATTSIEQHEGATSASFDMFSTPMNQEDFMAELKAAVAES